MSALLGATDANKMSDLGKKNYKTQAVWFLNAYFDKISEPLKVAEAVWGWTSKFSELDSKKGKDGNELDEFAAHRFLESIGEVLSVKDMRNALRDIDLDFNKYVSLIEFIVWKYKKEVDIKTLVNASQSGNEAEVKKAQEMLEEAQRCLHVARAKAEEARKAEAEAKSAEAENKRCLAELQKEEEAYTGKIAELEAISTNATLGVVKKNKAAAELAQLKSEDPLPLRRAKINQGAAVRKSERAAKVAVEARLEAEGALTAAEASFDAAEKYLNEVKNKAGSSKGSMWWIERDLQEARKYMPQRAGGVAKK